MKYPCPVCGYLTLDEPPGSYLICEICFWEDDDWALALPTSPETVGGPNPVTLYEAQQNFRRFGAKHERSIPHVRKPTPSDERDPLWYPISEEIASRLPTADDLECLSNEEFWWRGRENRTKLYYWRPDYLFRDKL